MGERLALWGLPPPMPTSRPSRYPHRAARWPRRWVASTIWPPCGAHPGYACTPASAAERIW